MDKSAKIHIYRFSELDGLEIKEATFLNKRFPKHFHTEWSLGRIALGCENIQFENNELCLFANATILIPPYSVHSNWGNKDASWKYQSIYLNEDFVQYVARKTNSDYRKLLAQPYYLSYNLPPVQPKSTHYSRQIEAVLTQLFTENNIAPKGRYKNKEWVDYLNINFRDKITLSDLERTFKINKYKILRAFKTETGLTPQEYITALRMENAKKLFFDNEKIVNIALDNGFYDQSHFVHTFKKYFGVTPFAYKSNCNILQD